MYYTTICILIFALLLYFLIYYRNDFLNNRNLVIYISSCNRYIYLNTTIHSIVDHMNTYEKLKYQIIIFDQGTKELRRYYLPNYYIYNFFLMNPCGYAYTYNIIFSYLYTKYALLIDDDRPVRKNIENNILYKNFIELSMNIMDKKRYIFGFILKQEGDGKSKCYNYNSIKYCNVENAYMGYYYSNGASIYKTKNLKSVKKYISERNVAKYFSKTPFRMAYLCCSIKCKSESNMCNYFIDHIGRKSSLKNRSICNIYMY